jgi:hypothetical protein
LKTSTIYGGNYGLLANYSKTGDFLAWTLHNGTFNSFFDTGNNFTTTEITTTGIARRYLLNISTSTVKAYKILIYYETYAPSDFTLAIFYGDGSFFTIANKTAMGGSGSTKWFNGTFTASKTLNYIQLYETSAPFGNILVRISREWYYGWFPSLYNYTDYTGLPKQIDTNVQFSTFARNCSLVQCHFLTTWGTTYDLDLASDWTYQFHYFGITQLHNVILYRYYYVASNEWGIATTSPLCFLSIMEHPFPQIASLNLYSTIDGLGLDTNLLQYYFGDSEEISCVDFNTYYGAWSKLYASNLSAQFIDNYLQFNTTNNGLKTTFKDMATIDTLDYNVLLFECQVFNPMWLVAIFNPSLHMNDNYYYQFNTSNVGNWYNVIIPFFNFTNYWSYSTDLGEIGFWISSGRINIANIRVAHYYDASAIGHHYTKFANSSNTFNTVSQPAVYYNTTYYSTNAYVHAFNYTDLIIEQTHEATHILDDVYWKIITTSGNNKTYSFNYLEFNVSSIPLTANITFYLQACAGGSKELLGNISIYNFVTNQYVSLWQISSADTEMHYAIKTNANQYINATHFIKVQCYSGYDYGPGIENTSTFSCDFFSITTSYTLESFYIINRTVIFPFTTSNIVDYVYLTLTVWYSSAGFDLYCFRFDSHTWHSMADWYPIPCNYTNLLIFPVDYNNSLFMMRFILNSSTPATLSYCASIRYITWEYSYYYTANPYRLVSPANAADPANLIFTQQIETLAILDFFNNTVWRGEVDYGEWAPNVFVKVGLPITSLYLINYANYSIVVDVQRGLGVYIQVVVPPNSMISVRIFSTSYLVTIRNLNMILLNITSVSCNRSKTVTVTYGKLQSFAIPAAIDLFLIYLLIGIVLAGLAVNAILTLRNRFKLPKFKQREEKVIL